MPEVVRFFSAPIFADDETNRRAWLLNILINLHIVIAVSTFILLTFFTEMRSIYPIAALLSAVPGLALRWLMQRGQVTLASVLFVSMIFALMPLIAWAGGSSAASVSVTVFQAITIVMAGLLLGGGGAAVFVLLTGLVNGAMIYSELTTQYVIDTSRDPISIWLMQVVSFSAIAAMLFITNRLIRRSFARAQKENLERRAAEDEVRKLNNELEQRVHERTAELEMAIRDLESFSYTVSHDLRAPLRSVYGYTKILREDYRETYTPEVGEYLEKIQLSSSHMSQMIDKLLEFSRVGRGQMRREKVDLNPIVREAIESLSAETRNRQIEWVLADLPSANVDPLFIQLVFANLIGNAVKYSSNRSRAHIEVAYYQEQGSTVYFVKDDGTGFDMSHAGKIFGVFERLHTDQEFEGTGIGLAIVQRIIQRHDGRIWAEAEPDKGATFYFTLA